MFLEARSSDVPHFIEKKVDLDSHPLRVERYAIVANWPQAN